jgi:hypothetical protein
MGMAQVFFWSTDQAKNQTPLNPKLVRRFQPVVTEKCGAGLPMFLV